MVARVTTSHAFTEAAREFCDYIRKLPGVTAVSPGEIRKISSAGDRRVKIVDDGGSIYMDISRSGTVQSVRVYVKTEQSQSIKLALARHTRNRDYHLSFG